jgi:hypothetical protein
MVLHNRVRGLALLLGLTSLITATLPANAENDFMAMPGLWKTSYRGRLAGKPLVGKPKAQPFWHCVDEEADPWIAFAQLQPPDHESCTRTSYTRTATSLKWRVDCSGPFTATNEGSINFDTATHYAGSIRIVGTFMGYPTDDTIVVEGERIAACTSPSD